MTFYTYITTSPKKTTLYTGQTSDIKRRIREHYENRGNQEKFAGKYYCYNLLHLEEFSTLQHSIDRENEIKNLSREKKFDFIKELNPNLFFLNDELFGKGWQNEPLTNENIESKK